MSRPAPLGEPRSFAAGIDSDELRAASLRRRRIAAAKVRRRRLMLADLAVAVSIALIALILAPGLAIVALGALVVLAVCGAWLCVGRLRARRARGQVEARVPGERGPRGVASQEPGR